MKNCEKYQTLFVQAMYNELESSQAQAFEAHLKTRANCQAEFQQSKSLLKLLSQKKNDEPKAEFWDTYWFRLKTRMESDLTTGTGLKPTFSFKQLFDSISVWSYQFAGAAAMLLIGILIGYLFFAQSTDHQKMAGDLRLDSALKVQPAAVQTQAMQYIERSKILLLGMINIDPELIATSEINFAHHQKISRELVTEANALKKQLKSTDSRRLLNLITELERILMQIANIEKAFDLPAIELISSGVKNQAILLKINIEEMKLVSDNRQSKSSETF